MKNYEAQRKARVDAANAQIVRDAAVLPTTEAALMALAVDAFADYDRAISNGDYTRASASHRRLDAIAYNFAGGDLGGIYRAMRQIEERLAPKPGVVPTWGLNGEYLAVVDGIKFRCVKLGGHLSLHAVEADGAFISPTGFMSCTEGYGFNGDVQAATFAKIRKLIGERGRVSIDPQHREHIRSSQPSWVANATGVGAGDIVEVSFIEASGQLAFAF